MEAREPLRPAIEWHRAEGAARPAESTVEEPAGVAAESEDTMMRTGVTVPGARLVSEVKTPPREGKEQLAERAKDDSPELKSRKQPVRHRVQTRLYQSEEEEEKERQQRRSGGHRAEGLSQLEEDEHDWKQGEHIGEASNPGPVVRGPYEGRQGAPSYKPLPLPHCATTYTGSRLRPLTKPGGAFDDHLGNLPDRSHVHMGGGSVGRDGGRGIYPHPACSAALTLAAPGPKEKQVVGLGAPHGCAGCTLNIVPTTSSTSRNPYSPTSSTAWYEPVQSSGEGNLHEVTKWKWTEGERIGEAQNPGPWVNQQQPRMHVAGRACGRGRPPTYLEMMNSSKGVVVPQVQTSRGVVGAMRLQEQRKPCWFGSDCRYRYCPFWHEGMGGRGRWIGWTQPEASVGGHGLHICPDERQGAGPHRRGRQCQGDMGSRPGEMLVGRTCQASRGGQPVMMCGPDCQRHGGETVEWRIARGGGGRRGHRGAEQGQAGRGRSSGEVWQNYWAPLCRRADERSSGGSRSYGGGGSHGGGGAGRGGGDVGVEHAAGRSLAAIRVWPDQPAGGDGRLGTPRSTNLTWGTAPSTAGTRGRGGGGGGGRSGGGDGKSNGGGGKNGGRGGKSGGGGRSVDGRGWGKGYVPYGQMRRKCRSISEARRKCRSISEANACA